MARHHRAREHESERVLVTVAAPGLIEHSPLMRHGSHCSDFRSLTRGAALLVLALMSGGCLLDQSCTDIGCRDQATINVRESDDSYAALTMEVEVTGRRVRCTSELNNGTCDASDVRVTVEQLVDCVEKRNSDSISEMCTPNGKFRHAVSVEGAPSRVSVTLSRADGSSHRREFELSYEQNRPNGPDCEPVCKHANADWTL
jgi:hypothetical protein